MEDKTKKILDESSSEVLAELERSQKLLSEVRQDLVEKDKLIVKLEADVEDLGKKATSAQDELGKIREAEKTEMVGSIVGKELSSGFIKETGKEARLEELKALETPALKVLNKYADGMTKLSGQKKTVVSQTKHTEELAVATKPKYNIIVKGDEVWATDY